MLRPLRWHERLLLRLLARSPRIDQILILQYPCAMTAQQQQDAAELQRQIVNHHLEQLYQSPPAER
jgi:hypothetical protein